MIHPKPRISRLFRIVGLPLLCTGLLACGRNSAAPQDAGEASDGGGKLTTREVLSRLEQTPSQSYSLLFLGESAVPSTTGLRVIIADAAMGNACGHLSKGAMSTRDDLWFLDVQVSLAEAGSYDVVYDSKFKPGPFEHLARVNLAHWQGTEFTGIYVATEGKLTLEEGVTLEGWRTGGNLHGTLDVSFPEHAVQQLTCQGAITPTGQDYQDTCSCLDENGVASSCALAMEHMNCCADVQAARRSLHFQIDAPQCRDVCQSVAPDHCPLLDSTQDAGTSEGGAGGVCGTPACTGEWWPHFLVVNASDGSTADWHVYVTDTNGRTTPLMRTPCPRSLAVPKIACDFGDFTLPVTDPFDLHVDTDRGPLQATLSLPSLHSGCPSSLVRVPVLSNTDGSLRVGEPELLNPCAAP